MMFSSILSILLTGLFSLHTYSTVIDIVSEFSPKKMRSKTPATRKIISSWLHFYATIGFLCFAVDHESVFYVLLQEANTYF
jgi:hypothetical protein